MMAMKSVSFRLPEAVVVRLAATARARGHSKSSVVRAALEKHLCEGDAPVETSCLDLAADLVGCIEDDQDLSSHERHMKDYGR